MKIVLKDYIDVFYDWQRSCGLQTLYYNDVVIFTGRIERCPGAQHQYIISHEIITKFGIMWSFFSPNHPAWY